MIKQGVAICTFNRCQQIVDVVEAVQATTENCQIVVCDDGSTDDTATVVARFDNVLYVRGPNRGVAHNKNRALVALQHCDYIAILEDDLVPQTAGWFDVYRNAAEASGIHHFCRVQDREVPEILPQFSVEMNKAGFTPIYGPSPRGDLTFITRKVIKEVGGFHPDFIGVGHAHGEWSNRVFNSGLIPHPNKWVDIKEARDSFVQKGDTHGGRWDTNPKIIEQQKKANRAVYRRLKATQYIYCPLEAA